MAMTRADDRSAPEQSRLGCGREVDAVWARADQPPDRHEVECRDCQAARAGYAELTAATQHLRTSDENDPELSLNADLLTKIFSVARADARRGTKIPLRPPAADRPEPDLIVTEQAVATVVRRTSDTFAGIEALRCRVSLPEVNGSTSPQIPVAVTIELTLSVAPGLPIPGQADELRLAIIAAVQDAIGIAVTTVDIQVVDVLADGAETTDHE